MIRIKLGTNTGRTPVLVDENDTLQKVLQDNNVDYGRASIHVSGIPMNTSDFGKTLAELGVIDDTMILACTKTDNA